MRLEFIIILRRDILDNGVWLKIRKGAMRKKKKKSGYKGSKGFNKKKKKNFSSWKRIPKMAVRLWSWIIILEEV